MGLGYPLAWTLGALSAAPIVRAPYRRLHAGRESTPYSDVSGCLLRPDVAVRSRCTYSDMCSFLLAVDVWRLFVSSRLQSYT